MARPFAPRGMFQPKRNGMPSFYQSPASYGLTVGNANLPEYTFAPTSMASNSGSSQSVGGGGATSNRSPGLNPGAVAATSSSSRSTNTGAPAASTTTAFTSPISSSPYNHYHVNSHNQHLQQQQQPHHQQLQLPLHGLPSSSDSSSYHQQQQPQNHQHLHNYSAAYDQGPYNIKMEAPSDLAQQEAAARDYQPELEGPNVSDKKSSEAITQEYAKANPVYVAKTVALPSTYSTYRQVQGDGNCGWRAIGFAYFENLVQCGDIDRVKEEFERIKRLNDFIEKTGGFELYLFEDIIQPTKDLFEEIIGALENGQDAMPIVLDMWNGDLSSNGLIYHLRLLAASCLKGNLDKYHGFITGDPTTYCDQWIMPVNKEIDQIAIHLLFDVFLAPADMTLEIAYLDLTPGGEVNTHRWPDEAKYKDPAELGLMICLLYRPDHYDILYRSQDNAPVPAAPPAAVPPLQVNRVASLSHGHNIQSNASDLGGFSTMNMGVLAMIPSFGGPAPPFPSIGSPPPISPMDTTFGPAPQSVWIQPQYAESPAVAPSPLSPAHSATSQPSPQPQTQDAASLTSLRFSKHMFPVPGGADAAPPPPEPAFQVQTNIFKQSYYNIAHYNNPQFQPEEYKPEQEDDVPTTRMAGRKKSSS